MFVFPNPVTGRHFPNESNLSKRWTAALKAAEVMYWRQYHCRHTYASTMLSAGQNVVYVARQMGHKDWNMLVQRYGRWLPKVGAAQGIAATQTLASLWEPLIDRLARADAESPALEAADEEGADGEDEGAEHGVAPEAGPGADGLEQRAGAAGPAAATRLSLCGV